MTTSHAHRAAASRAPESQSTVEHELLAALKTINHTLAALVARQEAALGTQRETTPASNEQAAQLHEQIAAELRALPVLSVVVNKLIADKHQIHSLEALRISRAIGVADKVETYREILRELRGGVETPPPPTTTARRSAIELAGWLAQCRRSLPPGEAWPCIEEMLTFVANHKDGPRRPMSRVTMGRYIEQAEQAGLIIGERRGRRVHLKPGPAFPAELLSGEEKAPPATPAARDNVDVSMDLIDDGESFIIDRVNTGNPVTNQEVLVPYALNASTLSRRDAMLRKNAARQLAFSIAEIFRQN